MGTLLCLKFRRKWPPRQQQQLPVSKKVAMICIQFTLLLTMIGGGSGGVNLPRPYLFRDYGMPQAFTNSAPHAQLANLYQKSVASPAPTPTSSHYADSEEVGSSEEEVQYTAPLILDIDDPEGKARWMGFTGQDSVEADDDDDPEDEDEYYGSISSTEFSSRSSAPMIGGRSALGEDKNNKNHHHQQQSQNNHEGSSQTTSKNNGGPSDESRGMLDNFKIMNPLSGFWNGQRDDGVLVGPESAEEEESSIAELPQSDEAGEYNYYDPYAYDTSSYNYYDQHEEQHDQKRPKPKPAPGWARPKQKPQPVMKPRPKPMKPPKSKPPPKPKPLKLKKKKRRPRPHPPPQYHYQEFVKPDKLSIISDKLSKLNPFNYVQIKPPQITITKTYDPQQPPHGPPRRKPQKMKKKKPKRPKRPKPVKIKKPKPPPKPGSPNKKQIKRPGKKPMDETSPEFEFYFGNPFGGYSADDFKGAETQYDYRQEDEDAEDAEAEEEEDDDDDEEDEEDEEEEDDYFTGGPMQVVHDEQEQEQTSTEEGAEAAAAAEDDDANNAEGDAIPVEDDEADYTSNTAGGIPGLTQGELPTTATTPEDKEKSIRFKKIIGWRKRKRRPKKPKPARRPPNWKEYRPAPLLPEIPEGVHDAVLKVIKNVGFLPEYGKNEKYGGHNKIKGKFTKTRPITLHHGLLTEVLRRRR